jgi:hypothetical protein
VKYKRITASTSRIFHCSFKCQTQINLQWCNVFYWCYGSVYCVLKYLAQSVFFNHISPFQCPWLKPGTGEWFFPRLYNSIRFWRQHITFSSTQLLNFVHGPVLKIKIKIKKLFRVRISLRHVAQRLRVSLSIGPKWVNVHPKHFPDDEGRS